MSHVTHRSERRLAAQVTVYAELCEDSESQFFADAGADWSGGVFIATHVALAVGAHVAVELTLPSAAERVIRTSGQICWRVGGDGRVPGVGVQMSDLSEDELRRIDAFCRTRVPLVYEVKVDEPDSARTG